MEPASAPSRNRTLGGFFLIASTPGLYPRSSAATWLATLIRWGQNGTLITVNIPFQHGIVIWNFANNFSKHLTCEAHWEPSRFPPLHCWREHFGQWLTQQPLSQPHPLSAGNCCQLQQQDALLWPRPATENKTHKIRKRNSSWLMTFKEKEGQCYLEEWVSSWSNFFEDLGRFTKMFICVTKVHLLSHQSHM